MDRIINLKEEADFIEQYVLLRNGYCDLLVTNPVNAADTGAWLNRDDVEIRGIVRGSRLIGVSILYLERKGEIAFFSEIRGSGLGGKLLSVIEAIAITRGLREVWAWVLSDNAVAQRAFLKSGYQREKESTREFKEQTMKGFIFRKELFRGHP